MDNAQLEARIAHLENLLAGLVFSDRYVFQRDIQLLDGRSIQTATGTGTKIGTSSTQKLGFWGATPVVKPTTTGITAGFTAGGGTTVTDSSTFTGGTGSTAYRISDIVRNMKNAGLLTS